MIPILILAAGGSTRMRGADKLLEQVDGVPLLRRQVQRALATGQPVYVALPRDDHPRSDAIRDLDVQILGIPDASEGISGTMRGAVAQLPPTPAFMLLLGDLVAIETADMNAVISAWRDQPEFLIWRGTTATGKPGHPIIFSSKLRPRFADLQGDIGGDTIVRPLIDRTCFVPLPDNRARLDLDTPEDWENWRAGNV